MTKKAINLEGNEVEVADNTPVKTVNGVHHLLSPADQAEIAQKEAAWRSKAPARALAAVVERRKAEYGTPEEQLENIIENGLQAEQQRVAAIKARHPKP